MKQLNWTSIGNILEVEGIAMEPGTYTGTDGRPTVYSKDFIKNMADNITGKPIVKKAHKEGDPDDKVGFITAYDLEGEGDRLRVKGYVFEDNTISDIKLSKRDSLSIETNAKVKVDENLEIAKSGDLPAIMVTGNPACPTCVLTSIREVKRLEDNSNVNNNGETSTSQAKETALPAKPTLDDALAIVTRDVEAGGISVGKFMEHFRRKLEAIDEGKADIKRFLEFADEAVKAQYPNKEINKLALGLVNWESDENPYKKNLQAAEIEGIVTNIKEYSKDFDVDKQLEGVDNHPGKVVVLQKVLELYKAVPKKENKEIKLELGTKGNDAEFTKKANEISQEVFGDTLENVYKRMEAGE